MTFFFITINLMIIIFSAIQIWKKADINLRPFFWPAWSFKLVAGVCLGLFYRYRYDETGDTYTYFYDGVTLADAARKDFWMYLKFMWIGDDTFELWSSLSNIQTRAVFMVKLTSVFSLLTHDNYWMVGLYFSFISFAASWKLSTELLKDDQKILLPVVASFLFLPSFVFWSSGLIKESIAMASLFMLCVLFLRAWRLQRFSVWDWIMLPAAFWATWNLKYYYVAVFLPIALASLGTHLLFVKKANPTSAIIKIATWLLILIVPLVSMSVLRPNFNPSVFLEVIVANYDVFQSLSAAEDVIHFNNLEATTSSMLRNAPWALISGLFRPFIWESTNFFQLITALENAVLLVLTAFALTNVKAMFTIKWRMKLFTMLLYCICLCVFLTLSTPNFGTLSRYRGGFVPFFFLLVTVDNPIVKRLAAFIQRY